MKKRCADCGGLKDASEFYPDPRKSDGLSSYCRVCSKAKDKLYRQGWRAPKRVEVYEYLLCKHDLEDALDQLRGTELAKALGLHRSVAAEYKTRRYEMPECPDDDQLWMQIEAWLREEVRDLSNEREPLQERLPQTASV